MSGLSQFERLAALAAKPEEVEELENSEALTLNNDQRAAATVRGATTGYVFLGAYEKAMLAEFGQERATALHEEVLQFLTQTYAQMIRDETGMEEFDLEAIYSIISKLLGENMGYVFTVIERTPTRIMYTLGRCPIYDSSELLGMEGAVLQERCEPMALAFLNSLLKELNPNVSAHLNSFRQTADDYCIESLVLSS